MSKKLIALPDMLDITLPQALDFAAKAITLGDQAARVMAITAYPLKVPAAFLARLANMPGVTLSIHLNPTDPADLVKAINKAIGEYCGRIEAGGNALTIQRLEQLLGDAQELLRKLDQEQQQVLYVTVIVLLTANDTKELDRRTRQIESMLAATGMRARGAIFRQDEGLQAAGPWLSLPEGIKESFSRNMPAETAAAMFPFAVAALTMAVVFFWAGIGMAGRSWWIFGGVRATVLTVTSLYWLSPGRVKASRPK